MAIRWHSNRGSFDSELQPPPVGTQASAANWILTIHLRVELVQGNRANTVDQKGIVTDANGRAYRVTDWTPTDWNTLVNRYRWHVQRFWHDRFWLQTPGDVYDLDWPPQNPTHRPNILCHFNFQAGTVNHPHYQVRIWRITNPLFNSDRTRQFRSDSRTYDDRDLQPAHGQVAVIHEVGHLLGLQHEGVAILDPTCITARDRNAGACYAPANYSDQVTWGSSIMGTGMLLFPHHSSPWLNRIKNPTSHGLANEQGRESNGWRGFLQHHNGADRSRPFSALPAADFAAAVARYSAIGSR